MIRIVNRPREVFAKYSASRQARQARKAHARKRKHVPRRPACAPKAGHRGLSVFNQKYKAFTQSRSSQSAKAKAEVLPAQAMVSDSHSKSGVAGAPPVDSMRRQVMVLKDNLHARPSFLLLQLLDKYPQVQLAVRRAEVDTPPNPILRNSMIRLLTLSLKKGQEVEWCALGEGAEEILSQIRFYNDKRWQPSGPTEETVWTLQVPIASESQIARQIAKAIDARGEDRILAVYHPTSQIFTLGTTRDGHDAILESRGLGPLDAVRLTFERNAGRLRVFLNYNPELFDAEITGLMHATFGKMIRGEYFLDPILNIRPSQVLPADLMLLAGARYFEVTLDMKYLPGETPQKITDWLRAGGYPLKVDPEDFILMHIKLPENKYTYRVERADNFNKPKILNHLKASFSDPVHMGNWFAFHYKVNVEQRDCETGYPLLHFVRLANSAFRGKEVSATVVKNWTSQMAKPFPGAMVTVPLGDWGALKAFSRCFAFPKSHQSTSLVFASPSSEFLDILEGSDAFKPDEIAHLRRMKQEKADNQMRYFWVRLENNRITQFSSGKTRMETDVLFLVEKIEKKKDPLLKSDLKIGGLKGEGRLPK